MLESPMVSVSALLVRVAVLSVSLHAIKGLLGALLGLSPELVLLALLAGFDVGGDFLLRQEGGRDRGVGLLVACHRSVSKLGGRRLRLILLVADHVGASSIDEHRVHLSDDGHGVSGVIGGLFGASRASGSGRLLCSSHLLLVSLLKLLLRHEAELVLLVLELAIDEGLLHLEALELLLLRRLVARELKRRLL